MRILKCCALLCSMLMLTSCAFITIEEADPDEFQYYADGQNPLMTDSSAQYEQAQALAEDAVVRHIAEKYGIPEPQVVDTYFEKKEHGGFPDYAHVCFERFTLSDGQRKFRAFVLFPAVDCAEDALIITDNYEEEQIEADLKAYVSEQLGGPAVFICPDPDDMLYFSTERYDPEKLTEMEEWQGRYVCLRVWYTAGQLSEQQQDDFLKTVEQMGFTSIDYAFLLCRSESAVRYMENYPRAQSFEYDEYYQPYLYQMRFGMCGADISDSLPHDHTKKYVLDKDLRKILRGDEKLSDEHMLAEYGFVYDVSSDKLPDEPFELTECMRVTEGIETLHAVTPVWRVKGSRAAKVTVYIPLKDVDEDYRKIWALNSSGDEGALIRMRYDLYDPPGTQCTFSGEYIRIFVEIPEEGGIIGCYMDEIPDNWQKYLDEYDTIWNEISPE